MQAVSRLLSLWIFGIMALSAVSCKGRTSGSQAFATENRPAGLYQAIELSPDAKAKIEAFISGHVQRRSEEYSGPGGGSNFSYSCNATDSFIYCSCDFSDGGGLVGGGLLKFDLQGDHKQVVDM